MKLSDIPPDGDLLAALDAMEQRGLRPPAVYENVLAAMEPIARAFAARAAIDEREARRVILTEIFRRTSHDR